MPRGVGRRALLQAALSFVAASAGCLESIEQHGACEGVSIVRTELESENPISNGSDTIHVTVTVHATEEYTLVGQIETSNGRKTVERTLMPDTSKQSFEFGPYNGVAAFEFHIEDCMT